MELAKHFVPWCEASVSRMPRLVAIPETDQLAECLRIRHCDIEATANRLIKTRLTVAALTSIPYGEVGVWLELRFLVAEQFQSGNAAHSLMELVDHARDFKHQRPLRRDAGGVFTQGQRVAFFVEDGAEALEDRSQPVALPCPVR